MSPPIEFKSDCRCAPIMVHTPPPEHRRSQEGSNDAWMHLGSSRPRPLSLMKNFVRLVQFAWRYKIRFGLSVCCAVMVALLFFTELGAVYPLLHILFGSQNPQRWISEKIVSLETDILTLHAREEEAAAGSDSTRRAESLASMHSGNGFSGSMKTLKRPKPTCASTNAASAWPT